MSTTVGWSEHWPGSKGEQFLIAVTPLLLPVPPSSLMATRSFLALAFQEPWQKSTNPKGKAEPATRAHKDGKPA